MLTENSNMANEKEGNHAEIVKYQCHVHEKDLMPLLCKDCECPVCFDCLTTNHAGHKMGKLSEYIDDKIDELNDVVQKHDSTCFDVKRIEENIQKRRQEGKKQVEEMLQRVTATEEEIVKEVKNVCQQTIDQITNLAVEIENPMVKDEQLLNSFMSCNLFRKDSDEDCIKCFFFYNKLKMLGQTYGSGGQEGVPFTLVTRGLSTEKIFELNRSDVTDDQLSSDENLEQSDTPTNPHELKTCKGGIECYEYKQPFTEGAIDCITLISGDRSILRSKHALYHQSSTAVEKLLDNVEHFTYVSETDEILVILKGQSKIYRRPLSTKSNELSFFMSFSYKEVLCIGHNATAYIVVVLKGLPYYFENTAYTYICTLDDTGCETKPTQTFNSSIVRKDGLKLLKSSFLIIDTRTVSVTKGLTFESLFTYRGKIGNNEVSTFSPADACIDPDGNYLVIDSNDNTVHLLDQNGKFLRIVMSSEDGLRGIRSIELDMYGWIWMGCNDGAMHFVNYQHFKRTTRKERYLQRQKKIKATGISKTETKPDTFYLQETNTSQPTHSD